MTYSILLVVPMPDKKEDHQAYARWKECAEHLKEQTKQNKGLQILGENVVLISLQSSLRTLCSVLQGIPLNYKYAIFDEEIEWLEESKKV
jgi:broad specificity phosphatase PhoE